MSEAINLTVHVVLKHILDKVPSELASDDDDSDDDDEGSEARDDLSAPPNNNNNPAKANSRTRLVRASTRRSRRSRGRKQVASASAAAAATSSEQLLDFAGPKLIDGAKNWLIFYQALGQLNFIGRPLYLSIIFKLFVLILVVYVFSVRFVYKFAQLHIIDGSFRNPIFLFISCLGVIGFVAQILVTLYVNLFDLCPMYKILTTPKLCFLNTETQHKLGSRTLAFFVIMHMYNAFLMSMIANRNWTDFVGQFHLPTFLLECYSSTVVSYYLVGLTQMDLYIRLSFGHWLLALKSHLERQFTHLHRFQRRSMRFGCASSRRASLVSLSPSRTGQPETRPPAKTPATIATTTTTTPPPQMHLITLDEIQKNLNHMDDHLEVLRSVQISTIVLMTLTAFLGNGALFLLTYHLMADQSNYYHGFLFLFLSINYILFVFLSYAGDRWVFYALSSFVQTVEDEYFMQSNIKALDLKVGGAGSSGGGGGGGGATGSGSFERPDEPVVGAAHDYEANQLMQQILLIKKKDVLFCCEFLHQFENHLATPWSKLTFKSHLHMLRTFVTLIAAQIIFDHEH